MEQAKQLAKLYIQLRITMNYVEAKSDLYPALYTLASELSWRLMLCYPDLALSVLQELQHLKESP